MHDDLNEQFEHWKTTAERIGAGMLAAIAMLVSFEMALEHSVGHGLHHAKAADHGPVSEAFAKKEVKGETARLPEEYDIGIQTPDIAGL